MLAPWVAPLCLAAGIVGVIGTGAQDAVDLRRKGGVLLRRERRRVIMGTVYGAGALLWPLIYLFMPLQVHGARSAVAMALALLWPLALLVADLVSVRTYVPTQEQMGASGARTSGQWIVGAVFAVGVLLATMNRTQSGHVPISARTMLVGMLAIIALLVPTPSSEPSSDLSWTVYAAQRVVLHIAVGLFVLATAIAWAAPGAASAAGSAAGTPSLHALGGFVP